MDKSLQSLPGYQVNEYKIVLLPHEELARHIMEVRKNFNETYKIDHPSTSLPQVVLATFKQIQAFEERIMNRLRIVGMGSQAFKVELKNYGSYPSHTIFINVTSKVPISDLVKKIRHDAQKLMKLDAENKPHFLNDSHINLGMKLKPWQFEAAWKGYSHRHFTGRFIAKHMLLLRRKPGETGYKVIQSFDFENLPVDTKQGELF